jgi:uncharacterized protein (DUF2164 family)
MKPIKFEREQRDAVVSRIRRFFEDELEQPIGVIPAEQVLMFFAEEIGPFYYNQGLSDAQAVFARTLDNANDEIYALEQREARSRR